MTTIEEIQKEIYVHGIEEALFRDCRVITGRHSGETVYRDRPNHLPVSTKRDVPKRRFLDGQTTVRAILFKGKRLVVQTNKTVLTSPPAEIRYLVEQIADRFEKGTHLSPESTDDPIPISPQILPVSVMHSQRTVFSRNEDKVWLRYPNYCGALRAFIDTEVEWEQVSWTFTLETRRGVSKLIVWIGVDQNEKDAHATEYINAYTEFKELLVTDKESAIKLLNEGRRRDFPSRLHFKQYHITMMKPFEENTRPLYNE